MPTITDRVTHTLICIAAWFGWYALSILFAMLPAASSLYRSGFDIPALYILFWLPFSLFAWKHYQKRYALMPIGNASPPKLILPALIIIVMSIFYQLLGIRESWIGNQVEHSSFSFYLMAIVACLLAPVIEEIIFRGFLLNAGLGFGKRGEQVAMLIASLLFCAGHTQYFAPATFIWLFVFSIILCKVRLYTGSLLPGMILHGLNNIVIFSVLILYR